METSEVAFKPAVEAMVGFVLLIVLVAAAGAALPPILDGVAAWRIVLAVVAGVVAGLIFGVLLVAVGRRYRVYVSRGGVRSFDFWGRYHRVAWADIQTVEPVDMAGLRYLKLTTARAPRPVWIPLFLDEQDAFNRLVAERAGPQHPLTRALEDRDQTT